MLAAVHPRAYGEHPVLISSGSGSVGSSPCLRGTPLLTSIVSGYKRFIPVLTGNTDGSIMSEQIDSVHPRAYGEHDESKPSKARFAGSSPCLRGTPAHYGYDVTWMRFIPVLTGNTVAKRLPFAYCPVHPRAYGEHCFYSQW